MGGVDTAPEMERMTDMRVYADQAATTSLSKTALEAMLPWMTENFGNPSALYEEGRTARDAVETAREKIAHLLHAKAKEIYFTSGGTEADNWALQMAAAAGARIGKKHIIVSAIEHHAVLNPAKSLERQGFRVTYLPVTPEGLVLPEALEAAICPDTALVSVMYANNEVGTIQPVEELAAICRMHGVWFHTDAVQAAGHVEIDLTKLQADFLSVSAHKFHGPKGVGFLFVRKDRDLPSYIHGGSQENGKRAGTENVAGIVGMAKALEIAVEEMQVVRPRIVRLRNYFVERVLREIPQGRLNGHPHKRLPGNVNFSFEGIDATSLLVLLEEDGICASAGSACNTGQTRISHVIEAIHVPKNYAPGSVRFTMGRETDRRQVDAVIASLKKNIGLLRGE